MREHRSIAFALPAGRSAALGLALAACSSDTSLDVAPHCNPLGVASCLTPWPSSVFEADDPTALTGRRIVPPEVNLLPGGEELGAWSRIDGFAATTPIAMVWSEGVAPDSLTTTDDLPSIAAGSPTLLLDLTTGARVPHATGLEAGPDGSDAQAVVLRPSAELAAGHRYAVAITRRVRARDGSELAVPAGFAALRDRKYTDHALLEAMRPRFTDVLAGLEAAGAPASELVVAWDFTVASDQPRHRAGPRRAPAPAAVLAPLFATVRTAEP